MALRFLILACALAGLLILPACSGPSQSTDESSGPAPDPDPTDTAEDRARASVARYETFDVTAYQIRPPERTVDVTHQVPRELMRGRADEGAKQTVDGYRIQVFSAQEQEAAQEFRERVRQWWAETKADAPDGLFRTQSPPIVIEYSQPYYRVRIGAFADRSAAAEALEFIRKEYSGAFIAQSTVTIVR